MEPARLRNAADGLAGKLSGYRQHLHRFPELSFEEHETAKYVYDALQSLGYAPRAIGKTGVIADLTGKTEGPTLALRADLDALPITEATGAPYASERPGVMHACGHDVHTACLLGAAELLVGSQEELQGSVRLIFQPGEEKLPGGASLLIAEGVLENPKAGAILGQHVMPELEAGKVGFRPGAYMASTDEIYITVKGKGGHGAMPHQLVDPIVITAHLILALRNVVSRWAKPQLPTVLSFGKVEGLGATNVIPDTVDLAGTFRTFDEGWRTEAPERLSRTAATPAESLGGKAHVRIVSGYPSLSNHAALTDLQQQNAEAYLGAEDVVALDLRTSGEDFAWYTQRTPGCFYRLGVGKPGAGPAHPVHSPRFDADEAALPIGAGLMAYNALATLSALAGGLRLG